MALYISSKWMNLYCSTPMDKPIGKPVASPRPCPWGSYVSRLTYFRINLFPLPASSGSHYLGLSVVKMNVANLVLRAIKV